MNQQALLRDQPCFCEHPGQFGEPFERARRVVADEVAHAVEVRLGERARVGRVAQQVLELIEVTQLAHRLQRLAHPEGVVPAELVGLAPTLLREQLAEMTQKEFLALDKKMATKDDVKLILSAIENLSGQIADVKQSTLSAIDFVRLEERVDVIEKKLGIVR